MNKKILGIRLGTYLCVILSVICAVLFWLYAKAVNATPQSSAFAFIGNLIGIL
jgi:flagellar basal body-associated protein FliL